MTWNTHDSDDRAVLEALRLRRAGRRVSFVGILAKRFDDTEAPEGVITEIRAVDAGPDPHAAVEPPDFVVDELLACLRVSVVTNTEVKLSAPEASALIDTIEKAHAAGETAMQERIATDCESYGAKKAAKHVREIKNDTCTCGSSNCRRQA